jgi:hypothetical protein
MEYIKQLPGPMVNDFYFRVDVPVPKVSRVLNNANSRQAGSWWKAVDRIAFGGFVLMAKQKPAFGDLLWQVTCITRELPDVSRRGCVRASPGHTRKQLDTLSLAILAAVGRVTLDEKYHDMARRT